MKILLKNLSIILIICLNVSKIYSQTEEIKFERISVDQGLSQKMVTCILQDKSGFMWIGTNNGLNKYNGYNFKTYKHSINDSTSLSENSILSIYEDRSGVLWIGTGGGGLNKFNKETDKFFHYKNVPNNPNSLINNSVRTINEDKSGMLLIGTDRGLSKFDKEKGIFTNYINNPNDTSSLSNNLISSIYKDRSGVVWIGTNGGGLNKFNEGREIFKHYKNDPNNPTSLSDNRCNLVYEDRSGVLWIGTANGLSKFDREKEIFHNYTHDPNNPNSLIHNWIVSVFEDSFDRLWIGTVRGLSKFDKEKGIFTNYINNPIDPSSLSDNLISYIYEDRSGVLWVGTRLGGINKLDGKPRKFSHYKNDPNNPGSLSSNNVMSFYEDRSGVLWIGTVGGGLNRFDKEKGISHNYTHDPNNPNSLSSNNVTKIFEDRFGVLWIGTAGGGLNRFDREKEIFKHYKNDPDNPNSLSSNVSMFIFEDRFGVLWIGADGGGLNRFDREKEIFKHYKNDPNNPNSLSSNNGITIYEDRFDVLWLGTRGGGLNRFDREKEIFHNYTYDPNNPTSLSDNRCSLVYEDRSGILWIGTANGLNKFDREKEIFKHFTVKDGLPNNSICGILEDNNDNLWISTDKGISKFNPKNKTFKNYDVKDGLQSNEFSFWACFKSKSGEMFFGGINGFNSFYPDSVKDNPHIPPIVITSFKKFDKDVKLDKDISEVKEIEISYKDDYISFEFAALDYTMPEKNQYAYMLEGFDKDWIYSGTRRYASYTNLDHGEFIFSVKGSNNDGVWNEEGVSVKLIIIPPFWGTWWFKVSSFITIIFIILAVYQIKTMSIKRKSRQLEEAIDKRTVELTESYKQLEQEINIRKEADESLRESEEKYRRLFNMESDVILLADDETGEILDINQAGLELYGYSMEELKHNKDIMLSAEQDESVKAVKGHKTFIPLRLHRKKDGTIFPVEIKASYFTLHGRKVHVSTIRDITERKKAEETLQRKSAILEAINEVFLETLVCETEEEVAYTCINMAERLTGSKYGLIGEINEAGRFDTLSYGDLGWAICKMPESEAIALSKDMELRGVWAQAVLQEKTQIINDPASHPARIGTPEGHPQIYSFMGVPLKYSGSTIGMIGLANKEGGYDSMDQEAVESLSIAFVEALRRKRAEEEIRKHREHLEELVKERTGELEKKSYELEQANIQLQETDRLKSVFLATMSHELRTPLNSIIGFTGIILQGIVGEINDEQKKQLAMVKNSANHLLGLINDVLDVSKIEAGKVELIPEEFILDDVVGEVVETLSPRANKKDLELITDNVPKDNTLFTDKRRLKQILLNLVTNAVKFTDQGSVKIAARILNNKNLEIRVIDTGIGIKKEDMNKLFAPFQQVDMSSTKSYEGTGLGLHLSGKLANLLGGNISAKSEYGKGSEFILTIPLKFKENR